MSAVGIHSHAKKKLGLRAPKPSPGPSLKLAKYLKIPQHPRAVDHLVKPGLTFGLYGNDQFGVCGPTSVANSRRMTTAWLSGTEADPTQEDVFDLYRRSGNPNFDPTTGADDNGVDMQTMLDAVHKDGIGANAVKCIAFAAVNTSSHEELRAAISIFGDLLFGVQLETAQQTQERLWSYVPTPVWGGHAVLGAGYHQGPEEFDIITWADYVRMTGRFVMRQVDQAWAVIWPEHLGSTSFQQGIDLNALKNDYRSITGRTMA